MSDIRTQQKFLLGEAISGASIGALTGAVMAAPVAYFMPAMALPLTAVAASVAAAWGAFVMGTHPQSWHHQGMEFTSDIDRTRRDMQADETAMMTKAQRKGEVPGIVLGGVEFSRKREAAHHLLVGLPGGGKTVIINNLLLQAIHRGDKILVHDPKGDFSSWMPEDKMAMLGPWDARAICWDVAKDISNPEAARTWMQSLVLAGMDNAGQNAFFYDAARDLGAGLLQFYQRTKPGAWGWQDLNEDISGDPVEMIQKAAQGNPGIRSAFPGLFGSGTANNAENNIISTFRNGVAFIQNYALAFEHDAEKFSIRDFMLGKTDRSIVVMNNNATYETAAKAIFGGVLAVARQMASSAEMPEINADKPGVYLILDEYPQLGTGASDSIQVIEELGRSRGVRVLKAMQDYTQAYQRAGKDKGQAQLSVQQTRIFCKVTPETASEICKTLGKRQIARVQNLALTGQSRKGIQLDTVDVLQTVDLMDLKAPVTVRQCGKERAGIEFVMMKDGKIGKLFQEFPPADRVEALRPGYVEREAWVRGLLDYVERMEQSGQLNVTIPKPDQAGGGGGGSGKPARPRKGYKVDPASLLNPVLPIDLPTDSDDPDSEQPQDSSVAAANEDDDRASF